MTELVEKFATWRKFTESSIIDAVTEHFIPFKGELIMTNYDKNQQNQNQTQQPRNQQGGGANKNNQQGGGQGGTAGHTGKDTNTTRR